MTSYRYLYIEFFLFFSQFLCYSIKDNKKINHLPDKKLLKSCIYLILRNQRQQIDSNLRTGFILKEKLNQGFIFKNK